MNSFLFLSRFSVSLKSLNNYFFRWFAYKSLLSRFSVLINYNMWSSNHFSTSSGFPRFSGSRFFRAQVFQGPGFLGSRFFRIRVQGPGPGFRSSPNDERKSNRCLHRNCKSKDAVSWWRQSFVFANVWLISTTCYTAIMSNDAQFFLPRYMWMMRLYYYVILKISLSENYVIKLSWDFIKIHLIKNMANYFLLNIFLSCAI